MDRLIFIVMILMVITPAFAEENSLQEKLNLGFDYIKSGDYQKASYVFALVLEYDRNNADAYLGRGICFLKLGDNEIMTNSAMVQKAIYSFWKAQDLGVQESEIYYFLGLSFLALHKKDVAMQEYNILESLDKDLAKQLLTKIVAYKPPKQYAKEEVDLKHGFILLDKTKNGDRREIPINDTLRVIFNSLTRRLDIPYVFYDSLTGKRYKDIKRSFKSACKRSGVTDFRFHDLRHTFASHLVMAGVDLTTVKELLGHKDFKMTLRYSHLAPSHKVKALDVLDNTLNGKPTIQKLYNLGGVSNV